METNLRLEHVAKETNVYAEHVNVRVFSTFLIWRLYVEQVNVRIFTPFFIW
jgi:hypothetical protein